MKVLFVLALIIALFGFVVADHVTPDDDDNGEIPSGTFGPPLNPPVIREPKRSYDTFRAPELTYSVYEADSQSFSTQTVSVFSGFFDDDSAASTTSFSMAILGVVAVALVF